MKRRLVIIYLFTIFMFLSGVRNVMAADEVTGTSGTCSWKIDTNGNLTVYPTSGNECMLDSTSSANSFNSPWYENNEIIKTVKFQKKVYTNTVARNLFGNLTNMTSFNAANLDTSNTVNMINMFTKDTSLTTLDLSTFNTSNVTTMIGMFSYLENLTSLNTSGFDTSLVTDMRNMFVYTNSLVSLDLSHFNTSSVIYMNGMLSHMDNLKHINVSNFDTSNVTNMSSMFSYDFKLEEVDISSFDTSSVVDTSLCLFFDEYNKGLKKIKFGPKFDFKLNEITTGIFSRGTWLREEDGKTYSAVEIARRTSEEGGFPGTFVKQSNISKEMLANFIVNYKFKPFTNITSISSENEDLFQIVDNDTLIVKSIPLTENEEYVVGGSVTAKFENQVYDKYGNNYDLFITFDNIHIYNLIPKEGHEAALFELLRVDDTIILENYFYSSVQELRRGPNYKLTINSSSTVFAMDLEINIKDKSGNSVEGSYIYSLHDLDNKAAVEGFDEGINFISGIDLDSIVTSEPTLLKITENRISGDAGDNSTELVEFLAKADASSTKFTLTGSTSSCDRLMFAYYQPKVVPVELHDEEDEILGGGKIAIYLGDELIEEWDNDGTPREFFLNPGEYTAVETEKPEGYEGALSVVFYVGEDDEVKINGESASKIVLRETVDASSAVWARPDEDASDPKPDPQPAPSEDKQPVNPKTSMYVIPFSILILLVVFIIRPLYKGKIYKI